MSYQQGTLPKGSSPTRGVYPPAVIAFPLPPQTVITVQGGGGEPQFGLDDSERLSETYSLARSIKVLSLLDGVVLTLNALMWGPLFLIVMLLLAWGPASGFYSSREFHLGAARAYLAFYWLKVAADVARAAFSGGWWPIIPLLIDLALARIVWKWCALLAEAAPSEAQRLRGEPTLEWENTRPYFVLF